MTLYHIWMSAFDWKNPDFKLLKDRDENYPITIKYDGSWWHEGAPVKRNTLVKLFNRVLRYDSQKDEYWLITPAEQGRIKVEDVPYVIKDFQIETDNTISVTTNLDEQVTISPEHPLILQEDKVNKQALPYVDIKGGLKARFGRAAYYKLVEIAHEKNGSYYVTSGKHNYLIGRLDV